VQRLNDSRFGTGNVADINHYIRLGALGRAFAAKERHVLLIDEVDKADLEFPNDLLREIDEMRFTILEPARRSSPRSARSCSSPRTTRRSYRTRFSAVASSTSSSSRTCR